MQAEVATTHRRLGTLVSLASVASFAVLVGMLCLRDPSLGTDAKWLAFMMFVGVAGLFGGLGGLANPMFPKTETVQFGEDGTLTIGDKRFDWHKVRWSRLDEGSIESLTIGLPNGEEARMNLPQGSLAQIRELVSFEGMRSEMKLRHLHRQALAGIFILPLMLTCGVALVGAVSSFSVLNMVLGLALGGLGYAAGYKRIEGVDITVGSEGFVLRERLFSQFIRWRDLQDFYGTDYGLVITFLDGSVRKVKLDYDSGPKPEQVVERMTKAFNDSRLSVSRDVRDTLARGDRTFDQWHQALTSLANSQGDFRSAPIPDEALRVVLQDGESNAELRMAAALVLRARHGDAVSTELRAVAEGLVEPDAQQALRVVTENTLDPVRIESALSRVKNQ
ncbi:MAG: hypothetical protein Q8Q09_19625 [Deltaproteobacteria bacterium]|nr:hypothetical protein [Deltaproteobacteria bacterium]